VLRSFTVKNFRGFRDLTIEPLDRINLIAGMNNTGKTSLLEAIYLHINRDRVQLVVDVDRIRRDEDSRDSWQEKHPIEDLCGWLFHAKDTSQPIGLTSCDDQGVERTCTIRTVDATSAEEELREVRADIERIARDRSLLDLIPRVVYRYTDSRGEDKSSAILEMEHGYFPLNSPLPPWQRSRFLSASRQALGNAVYEAFSRIETEKREKEILAALHALQPGLQRLSLGLLANQVIIQGDIGLNRLVPLAYMGEGLKRLLSIVVAITSCPGGTVLIDEIENGLHHSVLQKVWTAIAHAARRANVQVFASTHSFECIEAAHEAFAADEAYDLRLHRLEQVDDRVTAVTYSQKTLGTSVEMNLEVR
jgi:predicted ATP-dependent endonuclease of OLD family